MSGAIILSIALLVAGINTHAVLAITNNVMYHSIGTVTEVILDTFAIYDGVPKIRCLAICSITGCPIAAWGVENSGSGDCRVLRGTAVSTSTAITLSATKAPLTVYVPVNSTLKFVQKPYALLLHIAGSYSWWQMRINCRNKGIALYSPTSNAIIGDLFGTYGKMWSGASDNDVEGTYRSEDGTTVAVPGPLWCSGEPNGGTTENCMCTTPNKCFFDIPCSLKRPGLCIVGK
ncbi:uncharacterized protein [Palaemon carinicauda]|uniref:uncharacterized protein n=1 Tax=Palaemon carinicauda TaxID=392227 RepID=UPI0035B6A742